MAVVGVVLDPLPVDLWRKTDEEKNEKTFQEVRSATIGGLVGIEKPEQGLEAGKLVFIISILTNTNISQVCASCAG